MKVPKSPSLGLAFLPVIILIALLALNVFLFGDNALSGSNQMALLIAGAVAALLAIKLNFGWEAMLKGIVKSISSALPALLILLLIGALAGTWMLSGIVPAMIYYGLDILNPTIFLFATCLICAVVSMATGSSWSTVATVGIALLGIGTALDVDSGIVAGAIISGAYFGDKMSPLSDTTNLAPAMAGTDLITHIKYMTITTVPSIVITLIIFLLLGFKGADASASSQVVEMQAAIKSKFNLNPVLFLVPVVVIFLIVRKVPAIPALFTGALLGGVFAAIFQPDSIREVSNISGNYLQASYVAVMNAMTVDISLVSGNTQVDELLGTGGMSGMLGTIWLIVCAMTFGGIMEATGMLRVIAQSLLSMAKSVGSLVATTTGTCIFFNVTASDQYLSIVVPGRMFADEYKQRGLEPRLLSRTLEDSGTVTSPLVPWNTCGAYHSGVLGVATGEYLMYAFFNLISPLMTMVVGFLGWRIHVSEPATLEELQDQSKYSY